MCVVYFVPDPAIATLKISIESEVKSVNETFIVVCKDDTGRNVKWTSPKGNVLGLKTHPTVSTAIYGSVLKFNMTKVEDTGIYTCSTDKEKKHFHLTVEGVLFKYTYNTEAQKPTFIYL